MGTHKTEPGALAPGIRLPSRRKALRGGRIQLCGLLSDWVIVNDRIAMGDRVMGCAAELPALAPGADPGVSRERCKGRIVSARLACAPGGCHPSLVPPNPVPSRLLRRPGLARGAVALDIALDLRQWGLMNRASQAPLRVGQLTEPAAMGRSELK